MFESLIKTLIGGALGLGALYFTAKLAFDAGYEACEADREQVKNEPNPSEDICEEDNDPVEDTEVAEAEPKQEEKKRFSFKHIFSHEKSPIKKINNIADILKHPENHKMEASMDGNDILLRFCKRAS